MVETTRPAETESPPQQPEQPHFIFDDLATLQFYCKTEQELQMMYGRLFEQQINELTSKQLRELIQKSLRHRSDLSLFNYQVRDEHLT